MTTLHDTADYDEAVADIATAVAAEASIEWGLSWANADDRVVSWIKMEAYAHRLACRNLGYMADQGLLDNDTWQRIADAVGVPVATLTNHYTPEPAF
ncbi:MAG: hypothetical protein LBS56_02225 [Propionibacteriaceae bacterium]|jgi:hypothetical protein|nr:hypothetical protein [Propionibacteriaceae bacterium]